MSTTPLATNRAFCSVPTSRKWKKKNKQTPLSSPSSLHPPPLPPHPPPSTPSKTAQLLLPRWFFQSSNSTHLVGAGTNKRSPFVFFFLFRVPLSSRRALPCSSRVGVLYEHTQRDCCRWVGCSLAALARSCLDRVCVSANSLNRRERSGKTRKKNLATGHALRNLCGDLKL